ncbi:outer membrane beta-barrel protein [Pelagicoccus mobilis]|uniref:Outer membrane beta-barrel protein n=1 Tax=Pelagicoccus mobilis TaxID=415221 RepID=A0A934RQ26_9BACT|nr:outer membrane beta-barrel protein [Pelagicoccus mobilis]MBK1875410.1 outer membrane beta-barrel protein [Pelagicoccus mobilis]
MIRSTKLLICVLSGIAAFATTITQAGPRVAGGDLTILGTVEVTETDRASPNATSSSDTIFRFTPAFNWARESNRMALSSSLSFPMSRYEDNDALDSDSISFSLNGEMPFGNGPKLSGDWGISYFDGVQASYFTNQNLDSEDFSANAYIDYLLQRKLSFRSRISYQDRSSNGIERISSNDHKTTLFAAGLHSRDFIRGRIGLYAEYVIQERKTNSNQQNEGIDDTDDGLNFGITGQILPERLFPKLDADLSFGFTSTGVDSSNSNTNSGDENRLTLNGRLAYPFNPKTNVALTYNRNLDITDDDQTVESSTFELSLDYTPKQKLSFVSAIAFESNDYIYDINSRNDDVFRFSFGANYSIRSNWFASFSIDHRDSSSNNAISDYDSTQFTLSTTIQF